jgi:serine/threonine-protein kinase
MAVDSKSTKFRPVLVSDLADSNARDYLAGVALAGGSIYLPLIAPPATASTHVLEVYTPGATEPLTLFALPLGAPTAQGFPLQLRVYDPNELVPKHTSDKRISTRDGAPETLAPASELRAKNPTNLKISIRHSHDLAGDSGEAPPEELVGRSIAAGKLRIEGLIGSGGVGSVYRASHRDLRMPVAVKILHSGFQQDIEFCRRFHAEALAASRLDHPNLMRVLDFGQEPDGLLYLAMEHLDGQPLSATLKTGLALPLIRIVELMMQVCAGLAHAHARGIVHRDIKPENVVVVANTDDDGRAIERVKVCDFGIAQQQADSGVSSAVVGTPDYMSPEQCRGEALDGRSDVYACGVMLYELGTGHLPFNAPTAVGLLNRHMNVDPRPPRALAPNMDPRLETIIMKALAKEPADRQQSTRELRRELRALLEAPLLEVPSLGERSVSAPPPSTRQVIGAAQSGDSEWNPDWLERSGTFRHDSIEVSTVAVNGRLLATELAAKPAGWLATFAHALRPEVFEPLAQKLAAALPILATERNVRALFAVRCTLDELATVDAANLAWRSARAHTLLAAFGDPVLLTVLAEATLANDRPPREVKQLLLRVGAAGSYALYSTRLKHASLEGIRPRFVATLREFGMNALPMIRAGLTKLEPRRDHLVAAELAIDLFEACPRVLDEEAGELAALYIPNSPPVLTRVAAEALVWLWGARATPLLLGLLGSEDDSLCLSAIAGMRELGAIDEYAVTRLAHAVRSTTSPEVGAAARAALSEATGNARVVALRALAQLG